MKRLKKESGITLIALVVIVIVLLILAGISISVITGNNGILNRSIEAKNSTEENQIKEEVAEKWYQFEKDNIDNNYTKEQKVNLFVEKYRSDGLTGRLKNGKIMEIEYKGVTVKINI